MQPAYDNLRSGYKTQGSPLFETALEVSLVADNTNINTRGVTTLYISSDNTTATNRTFTITDGDAAGHQLRLIFVSGGSTTADLQDTGNVRLSAAWQPTQNDTLVLYYVGTAWVELARSDN